MTFSRWILLFVLNRCFCYDLTYFVKEEQSAGIYIGDIARDTRLLESVPSSDRRLIRFSQLLQGVVGSPLLFRVARKTGKIYTSQSLDAELLCRYNKECAQFVKVAVRREESFIKILKVRVIIKDINDHIPEFPVKQINLKFTENDYKGTKVSIPNAVDRDIGLVNSRITYDLENNDYGQFMLSLSKKVDGNVDLGIELKDRLDREVQEIYLIRVIAKDGGSPSKQGVLQVNVSVADINDNTPVFSQSVYNVSLIYEHSRDDAVAVLSARDLDSGKNGQISYHFSPKTSDLAKSYFELKELSGEIYLRRKFETEQDLTYELFVKATDGGNPPLSSIALVFVNVINQQNTAPIININFFSASTKNSTAISEDIRVGSFIAYVMAIDRDAGRNGEVSCDLKHDKFQLQSLAEKEYKITVSNPVDRETEDHYEITIVCRDKGAPSLHSEASFSIQVTDVNDMKPQFSNETFIFYINENEKSGTWVGSINATDLDLGLGGKLTYSLLTNNERFLPFQITDDGNLCSVMSLDSEFQDMYKFWVVAKDSGRPALNNTAHVSVKVQDLNDNAPYFTFPSVNPFTLDIVHYPNQTRNITTLKAADSDSLENAFLKYELSNSNDKQLFHINEFTGLLSFGRELAQTDSGFYNLRFVVKDSGDPVLSATTNLNIRLIVSNKTFEKMNAFQVDPNDRIHIYLLIFIVLVAILASVIITAPISICVIRCNDQNHPKRKRMHNPSNKRIRDLRMSMCPTYWSEVPDNLAEEEVTLENTLSRTKGVPSVKYEANKELRNRCLEMKTCTDKDVIYEEVEDSCEKGLEELSFLMPNTQGNMLTANIDNDDCWSEGDMRQEENGTSGHFSPNDMKSRAASPSLTENPHSLDSQNKTSNIRTFSSSLGDADSISRRIYKSRINNSQNNCRDCDSLRTNKTESSISGSHSQVGTWSHSSSHPKLHRVPEMMPHLDCIRQIALDSGQMVCSDISIQAPVAKRTNLPITTVSPTLELSDYIQPAPNVYPPLCSIRSMPTGVKRILGNQGIIHPSLDSMLIGVNIILDNQGIIHPSLEPMPIGVNCILDNQGIIHPSLGPMPIAVNGILDNQGIIHPSLGSMPIGVNGILDNQGIIHPSLGPMPIGVNIILVNQGIIHPSLEPMHISVNNILDNEEIIYPSLEPMPIGVNCILDNQGIIHTSLGSVSISDNSIQDNQKIIHSFI